MIWSGLKWRVLVTGPQKSFRGTITRWTCGFLDTSTKGNKSFKAARLNRQTNRRQQFVFALQSVDPFREHPGHQGERPAAASEAQQRLEEGVRGAGGVPALSEGGALLENKAGGQPTASAAAGGREREEWPAGADGGGRVQHLLHQQRAGPPCKWHQHCR